MKIKDKIMIMSILLCSLSLLGQNPDFLNTKYQKEYSLIIDESNILDHPFFSYLNCNNEGYFSVHFIPKNQTLRTFWSNYYTGNTNKNLDELNAEDESTKIKKEIYSNLKEYTIFCYLIEKENLKTNGPCSKESVFSKDESKGKIYVFKTETGKWEFIEDHFIELLPPYYKTSFFTEKFDHIFKSSENYLSNTLIFFAQNCESNNNVYINTTSATFNITKTFYLESTTKEITQNKYQLFFENFGKIIPLPKDLNLSRYSISKTKPIAIVTIKDRNTIELEWKGFYNSKTNAYFHTNNPFDPKQQTVILKFCAEN
jgi:hypothetical protein